jgi:ABC-type Na+ efflux pump permease subunit
MGNIEYGDQCISYFLFFAPGAVGVSIIFSGVNSGGMISNDRYSKILERLLSWPISRTSYFLSKILASMTISISLLLFVLLLGMGECPEVGTVSQGNTLGEAIDNLKEATELYLEEFPQKEETLITTFEVSIAKT